ncbi:MAG: hypothetical protein WBD73_09090, partial [Candidatus Acidiferrales bacterium]
MANILEQTNLIFEKLSVPSEGSVQVLFDELLGVADSELLRVGSAEELEAFRVRWVGRNNSVKSRVQENWLKLAPAEAKKWVGSSFNICFRKLEKNLAGKKAALQTNGTVGRIDLSLPGVTRPIGTRHLISQTYEELYCIFNSIGFSIVEGAEIETPYYNFEALNIP